MSDEQIESWASEFDEAGFPEIGEKMRKVLRAATVLETERMKQIPKEKAYSMSFKQDGYYDFGGNFIPYSGAPCNCPDCEEYRRTQRLIRKDPPS
jgi:hypothetical protein